MSTPMERLQEGVLDRMWAQWASLGVSSTVLPEARVIDPEALLVATSRVADRDPRLYELCLAWIDRYGRYVNTARLKRIAVELDATAEDAYVSMLALLGGERATVRPESLRTRSVGLQDFTAPEALVLRARALTGVNARADMLATLLARPDQQPTVSELARTVRLTKRAVSDAVQALAMGGYARVGSRGEVRLIGADVLGEALRPLVASFPEWVDWFAVALAVLTGDGGQGSGQSNLLQRRTRARSLAERCERAGLPGPELDVFGSDFGDAYTRWVSALADAVAPQLFARLPRTDTAPKREREPLSVFLGRASGPEWDRIRELLEAWIQEVPQRSRADLSARLRSADERQFHGAFWELYVHEWLRRQGFALTIHPNFKGQGSRPDFLAQRGADRMYVECTAILDIDVRDRRAAILLDVLNDVRTQDFFLDVDIESWGSSAPPTRGLKDMVERWLSQLDPDEVQELVSESGVGQLPTLEPQLGDWAVRIRPIPRSREARHQTAERAIGIYPSREALGIGPDQVLRRIRRKSASLRGLDAPLLVAVLVHEGLPRLSDPDPVRLVNLPPHVSGVLVAANLFPWNVARKQLDLVRNPEASDSLPPLDWEVSRIKAADLFALPEDWPGPENPFPE